MPVPMMICRSCGSSSSRDVPVVEALVVSILEMLARLNSFFMSIRYLPAVLQREEIDGYPCAL